MGLPRLIAIASQKGGVAKTTTCVSLGAVLAEQGKHVLMIDLDPQAHLADSLGFEPERLAYTVVDALIENAPLETIARETAVPFLDLVPSSERLALLEKWLYGRSDYEYLLKDCLDGMDTGRYDVILMDGAPSLGVLTLNALTAADLLIIPTQCEYFATRSLRRVMELVRLVREKTNPGLAYRVLITMFDRRNRISQVVRGQLREWFSDGLLTTVIELDTKLRESAAVGRPITLHAPRSRAAAQHRALARELTSPEWTSDE